MIITYFSPLISLPLVVTVFLVFSSDIRKIKNKILKKKRVFIFIRYKSFLNKYLLACVQLVRRAVASWSVRSTPERAVQVRVLAGDIVLCSWARQYTFTVPLSTQVYKWVPANFWGNLTKLRESDLRWTSIPSRGSRNTSNRFMLQKPG